MKTSYELGKYVCKEVFGHNPTGFMLNYASDVVDKIRDEGWNDFYSHIGWRDVPYNASIIDEAIARIIERFTSTPLRLTLHARDIEKRIIYGLR